MQGSSGALTVMCANVRLALPESNQMDLRDQGDGRLSVKEIEWADSLEC